MSSSPTTTAPAQAPSRPELLALLWSVPDPRDRRGVRHQLPVILAVGLAAVLTGARSFTAIGEWGPLGSGGRCGCGVSTSWTGSRPNASPTAAAVNLIIEKWV